MRPDDASAGTWAVVPVFDEAPTIAAVVHALRALCPVIVVDDASTDGSGERARAAGATRVVRHARRSGKGGALRTGFSVALGAGAERVATLDGDGQHDPADLGRLLRAARRLPRALVLGNRLDDPGGDAMPPLRRLAVEAADRAVSRVGGVRVRDSQCGFRIYPAGLLAEVGIAHGGFVLETAILVRAVRAGYPLVSVPVRRLYPPGRVSRFRPVADAARIGWFLVREGCRAPWRGPLVTGAAVVGARGPQAGEA